MQIHCKYDELVNPKNLKNHPKNRNKHGQEQVDRLAELYEYHGIRHPIIVSKLSGFIVAGHGRKLAAIRAGVKEMPVVHQEFESSETEYAFIQADNAIALWAELDLAGIKTDISDFGADFNMNMLGIRDFVLDEPFEAEAEEDAVPEVVKPRTKLGDIYQLGRHRLMCGDSTSSLQVETLLEGQKPDMVFTDPPYNIDYQGVSDKRDKIKNDKMSDDDFLKFLTRAIMPAEVMYVCCSWQYANLFKEAMKEINRPAKAMIVWDKVNPAQNLDLYFKRHEIIYYHGPFGGQSTVRGDVWQLKRQKNTVHPTMKPVELVELALSDHPTRKTVYDSFGGSGSTLIACEKTNRSCYMMELDPHYVDVIVARWEQFTGKTAELINGRA